MKTLTASALICISLCLPTPAFGQVTFTYSVISPTSSGARAIADFDGDGLKDVAVMQWPTFRKAKNISGDGQLMWFKSPSWKKTTITKGKPFFGDVIAAGDIDGNGVPDIVAGMGRKLKHSDTLYRENITMMYVYYGQRIGQTVSFTERLIGEAYNNGEVMVLAIHDFDENGKPDIMVRTYDRASIFYQGPDGQFVHRYTQIVPREGGCVGDVDHDGKTDIILNGYWLKNPGGVVGDWARYDIDPIFYDDSDPPSRIPYSYDAWRDNSVKAAYGDFDGDGRGDIVMAWAEHGGMDMYLYRAQNPTLGIKAWSKTLIGKAEWFHSLEAADLDNDGDIDLVGGETVWADNAKKEKGYGDGAQLYQFINGGSGTFRMETIANRSVYWLAIADIDNDGDVDLINTHAWNAPPVELFINKGNANNRATPEKAGPINKWTVLTIDDDRTSNPLRGASSTSASWYFGINSADFDKDGDDDIVSGDWLYRSPGSAMDGLWPAMVFHDLCDHGVCIDADNDGNIDILGFKLPKQPQACLHRYDGRGRFSKHDISFDPPLEPTPHMNPQGYVAADIYKGGKKEIVIEAGKYPDTCGVYVITIPTLLTQAWPVQKISGDLKVGGNGLAVGDIDGDGDNDVFIGNKGDEPGVPPKLYWFENPGKAGSPWTATTVDTWPLLDKNTANGKADNSGDRFAIADLDGDRQNDLIVTEETYKIQEGNHVYWYRNNGGGKSFTRGIVHQGGASYNSLAIGDFDRDSDLDIATADMGKAHDGNVWICENVDGKGTFKAHKILSSVESHGMISGDFNADGWADIATMAWSLPNRKLFRVFRNDNGTRTADVMGSTPSSPSDQVLLIQDATCPSSGLTAYKIITERATYYLEKAGAGLSSMIDRQGHDWISFKSTEGTGSAGEYRGWPNAVYKASDGNYFHAMNSATDRSTCSVVRDTDDIVIIKAVSSSGNWIGHYTFYPTYATFTMDKVKSGDKYWVIYEGTPGGELNEGDYYMTSDDPQKRDYRRTRAGDITGPEWIAFGDRSLDRVLVCAHHTDDTLPDRYYPMEGNMTVMGFGRGNGTTRYLTNTGEVFSIGLVESTSHDAISREIDNMIKGVQPTETAVDRPRVHPVPNSSPKPAPTVTLPPKETRPKVINGEQLCFDWNGVVTKSNRGFPYELPPRANGDWTSPINYAEGTLYYRVEIFSQPSPQNMKLQLCFWQEKNGYKFALENCGPQKPVKGSPGTVVTWSCAVDKMWKLGGKPIEWQRARYRCGVAIKNMAGKPVSDFQGWKWNGENPDRWYPLNMRFTAVVVKKGKTFSGWDNYITGATGNE